MRVPARDRRWISCSVFGFSTLLAAPGFFRKSGPIPQTGLDFCASPLCFSFSVSLQSRYHSCQIELKGFSPFLDPSFPVDFFSFPRPCLLRFCREFVSFSCSTFKFFPDPPRLPLFFFVFSFPGLFPAVNVSPLHENLLVTPGGKESVFFIRQFFSWPLSFSSPDNNISLSS